MRPVRMPCCWFAALLSVVALPAHAHHSRTLYDQKTTVTIAGVVTKYEWANPHIHLFVETQNEGGETVVWAFETGATTMMRRRGWSSDMFAPGDEVIVKGNPITTPGRRAALVESVQKNGVSVFESGRSADDSESPQLTADGLSGIWEVPLTPLQTLFSEPAASWPLTSQAAAAVQAYDDKTMNPQIQCMARTAPWVMIFAGVHEIAVADETVSIRTEYDTVERRVDMVATSHAGAVVSHQGHSIGRWEGQTLVVDTTHFTANRSGSARGVPSGPNKHLVERFALTPDRTGLIYRFELEDPDYLSAPMRGELRSSYLGNVEFVPIACSQENARRFVGD